MSPVEFPAWTLVPFALSTVFLGLPHGALDPWAAARLLGWPRPTWVGWAAIVGLYLLGVGAGGLLWAVHPSVAFLLFIALTWYHWGQGELEAAARWRGRWLGGRAHRVAYLVWRGSLPMIAPLVFQADVYAAVAQATLDLFGSGPSPLPSAVAASGPVAGVLLVVLWTGEKITAPAASRWSPGKLLLDAVWGALLLVLHPVFSVGLYFLIWHAPHHLNRLRHFLGRPQPWSWRRLWLHAAPLTLVSLAGLAVIAGLVPAARASSPGGLALYLVALACLTWPHAFLVTWQDRKEGIWTAASSP